MLGERKVLVVNASSFRLATLAACGMLALVGCARASDASLPTSQTTPPSVTASPPPPTSVASQASTPETSPAAPSDLSTPGGGGLQPDCVEPPANLDALLADADAVIDAVVPDEPISSYAGTSSARDGAAPFWVYSLDNPQVLFLAKGASAPFVVVTNFPLTAGREYIFLLTKTEGGSAGYFPTNGYSGMFEISNNSVTIYCPTYPGLTSTAGESEEDLLGLIRSGLAERG